jgi:P63C domain
MNNEIKKKAGKRGGDARNAALSDERKRQIASAGALARWGAQATHKGNFKEDFGIDVDCYVLNDAGKTAVISQRGMGEALGLSKGGGSRLPRFVGSKAVAPYVGPELKRKLEKPLIFQGVAAGPNLPSPGTVYGYDVTILIDLCKAIIEADAAGALLDRREGAVRQAHVILAASAKAGIKGLVYALAGYSPGVEEVIAAFKAFVRDEAREYEKEFPPLLYKEWQRLYEIQGPMSRNWKGMHLTVDHVYYPLAKSQGRILQLARGARNVSKETRRKKLHQFLSEIGVKALRTHLGQILGIARISKTKQQYEQNFNALFGEQEGAQMDQMEMNYETTEPPAPTEESPSGN